MWKTLLIALLMLGIGAGIGSWLAGFPAGDSGAGMNMAVQEKEPGQEAKKPPERKVAYWRAPMNPGYISDKPGKSPMGMDLVPVYEDELAAAGTVQIDPVTVQNIGVKTALVKRRSLQRTIRTVGRVDYDETRLTDVNTKVEGWVEKLLVDYTGQMVTRGQPLLEIYSPDLVAAQEEYLTALDYYRRLQANAAADVVRGGSELLNAAVQRLRYWDITDRQIAALQDSRQVKRTMTIYSPQEGIVVHKAVFEGAHIRSGQHLYRIGEVSVVWVYADIYEYELPWIKVGQKAEVELSYLPGKVFSGKVTYIFPFLDPKTRTVKVRMIFDNPELQLKPEMYTNVKIESLVSRNALVVPAQALIHSGERNIAIISLGAGKFQPREVKLGAEADGYYQVLEGVRQGERIVTSAQFLIDSESNLKASISSMSEPEEKTRAGSGMEGISAAEDRAMPAGMDMSGREMGESGAHEDHAAREDRVDSTHKDH